MNKIKQKNPYELGKSWGVVLKMIKLEQTEDSEDFRLYPFPMAWVSETGETTLASLELGGQVAKCYALFIVNMAKNQCVTMAIDFPPMEDIISDFVAIFHAEVNTDNNLGDLRILIEIHPYNVTTGHFTDKCAGEEVVLAKLRADMDFVCFSFTKT